jgi:hypothetical protein
MVVIQPSAADRALLKEVVEGTLIPKWATRCSAECVAEFNGTIGQVVGETAKKKARRTLLDRALKAADWLSLRAVWAGGALLFLAAYTVSVDVLAINLFTI